MIADERVSGFVAGHKGDGEFFIRIRKVTGQIYFRFHIAQHSRDQQLMQMFISFFDCGKLSIRTSIKRCDYYVQSFENIFNLIIPHFYHYPLCNIKTLDFQSFKEAASLYEVGGRNNTNKIQQIIESINSKRSFYSNVKQDASYPN